MTTTLTDRAPYATSASILTVVDKQRKVGLPKVDSLTLEKLEIRESLRPRTMVALRLLGLIDDEGTATPEFKRLNTVVDEDYKPAFRELLETVYAPIVEFLGSDLASATSNAVQNAFRGFEPSGQRDRMAQLFIGLMVFVGAMPEQATRAKAEPGVRQAVQKPKPKPPKEKSADEGKGDGVPLREKGQEQLRDEPPTFGRTVNLGPGAGSITLTGNPNPFALTGDARTFFYTLVDLIDEFAKTSAGHPAKRTDTPEVGAP